MVYLRQKPLHALMFAACSLYAANAQADVLSSITIPDLVEPADTYDTTAPTIINMTVKTVIGEGVCAPDEYAGCTLNDVLNDIDSSDDFKPEIKVQFSADDYPQDDLVSNAEFRQRGATSRFAPQKSFRVKLDKDIPLWRGERRMQLIKSFNDFSRVRNKLSYDLFVDVPNFPTMRTQFVDLTVEDQGIASGYGLYTNVEYFGKEYLERRGWDDDSGVYKSELFYFRDDPAFALDEEGEPLDEDAFEKLMEIKRGDDHTKFVEMLQALNNPALDFETEVFDKYFNKDNYLTWLAVNVLLANDDTGFHNYYLYNPKDTEKFYLVPWDYDLSLGATYDTGFTTREESPRWTQSHANWWGIELHQQFLKQPGNLALLQEAVLELKDKYFTQAKLQEKADSYYNIVFPLISSSPDIDTLYTGGTDPEKVAGYNRIFSNLSSQVEGNYERFLENIGDPMPFVLNDPDINDDASISFSWKPSVSLLGQTIEYDLEISTSPKFESGTVQQTIRKISDTQYTLPWTYATGDYFYRITARDVAAPETSWQIGYNPVQVEGEGERYGVVAFTAVQSTVSDGVSNPVDSGAITINGESNDWQNVVPYATDPNDLSNSYTEVIDWYDAAIAHDSSDVFLLYRNRAYVNKSGGEGRSLPWGWQTFMDTDNNPDTGYKVSDSFGADFIMEGTQLREYTGEGFSWSWQSLTRAESRYKDYTAELSFPRNLIGNPSSMRVIYRGDNKAFGGNTLDMYPDGAFDPSAATRYFSYNFGSSANVAE
jgi:hypothetical protein